MILLIDAGNTRAKYAWLDTAQASPRSPVATLDHTDLPRLADHLAYQPQQVLGSNVAGAQIGQRIDQACRQAWGLTVRWCDTHDGQSLLQNHYHEPARLGSDRWLGLLGLLGHLDTTPAWRQGHPALLASFGTATTLDTLMPGAPDIDPQRPAFIGGLILPGPSLMAHSLAQGTAQLPLSGGRCTDFPLETHDAIASGIAAAQAGALLRQWHLAYQQAQGRAPLVFVCGGGWPAVCDAVQAGLDQAHHTLRLPCASAHVLDSPVLDGLARLAP